MMQRPGNNMNRFPGQGMSQFNHWCYNGRWYTDDYFNYNVGPGVNGVAGNLAAAAVANQSFTIQADSNFEWIYSTWYAEKNGETTPGSDAILVPINIQITDGGSGRMLFSQPIPMSSIAGLGREPYFLPKKRIFMGKSTVTLFFQNFGADTWNNISFTLHGRKIFDTGSVNTGPG